MYIFRLTLDAGAWVKQEGQMDGYRNTLRTSTLFPEGAGAGLLWTMYCRDYLLETARNTRKWYVKMRPDFLTGKPPRITAKRHGTSHIRDQQRDLSGK